jgi:hypothetical protein
MTDIDPASDIELRTVNEHVVVRVPLAGSVTDEWLRCHQRLAHATGVPVQAQAHPDRAFAFLYWVLDGGGPDARLWAPPGYPDLAFPEQLSPVCAAPGWTVQAVASLAILGLVIARAVNILQ